MTLENKLNRALKSNDINKIHEVFDEIYTIYGKLVYFKISQYVDNKLHVEELTQDVFVSFYNNIMTSKITNIKYYLVTSAKN
jgi:DNA-directed RNA polymerase specialized sigma24 family protein